MTVSTDTSNPQTPDSAAARACPLCALPADDRALSDLRLAWYFHRHSISRRKQYLVDVIARHKLDVSLDEVLAHRRCGQRRPSNARKRGRDIPYEYSELLKPNDRAVLLFVVQMGVIDVKSVAEVVFPHLNEAGGTRSSARITARDSLNFLTDGGWLEDIVLPVEPATKAFAPGHFADEAIAQGLLVHREGSDLAQKRFLKKGAESYVKLPHNLGANKLQTRLFVDAQHRPQQSIELGGTPRSFEISVQPGNMFGETHLCFGHRVPMMLYGNDIVAGGMRNITPDGAITVGIRSDDGKVDLPIQLLLEHDTGKIDRAIVRDQVLDFGPFAYSGALGERFPDLAGYTAPVLFTTQGRGLTESGSLRRIKGLQADVIAAAQERRLSTGAPVPMPPIYLALHTDIIEHGWQCPVRCLHRGGRVASLLRALLADCVPQLKGSGLTADQVLRIDRRGAPTKTTAEMATGKDARLKARKNATRAIEALTAGSTS